MKLRGVFVWHEHAETDEAFIVIEGALRIAFRDGAVRLQAGEMFVVPKGVEHKPCAEQEVKLLLIEPRGVPNTGHEGGDRTAANEQVAPRQLLRAGVLATLRLVSFGLHSLTSLSACQTKILSRPRASGKSSLLTERRLSRRASCR